MTTDYRPEMIGSDPARIREMDPKEAVHMLENDLKMQAESLRRIRNDYIRGVISAEEMEKVEARFMDMLARQREILQLLRRRLATE